MLNEDLLDRFDDCFACTLAYSKPLKNQIIMLHDYRHFLVYWHNTF